VDAQYRKRQLAREYNEARMMPPVYCTTCEQMTHSILPHSCFSAAKLRAHRDAEQAVIAAAKAWQKLPDNLFMRVDLHIAVDALCALEKNV